MFEYALDDEDDFIPLEDVDGQYLLELTINSSTTDQGVRIRNEGNSTQVECPVPWMTIQHKKSDGPIKEFQLKVLSGRLPPLSYLAANIQVGEDDLRVIVVGNRMASTAPRGVDLEKTVPELRLAETAFRRSPVQPSAPSPPLVRTPVVEEAPAPAPVDFGLRPAGPRPVAPSAETYDLVTEERSRAPRIAMWAVAALLVFGLGAWGIHAWLASRPGRLLVESRPSGAKVTVKDEQQTTPFEFKLPPGEYSVKLKLGGYKAHSESVKLEPGQAVKLMTALDVATGSLGVTSSPSPASVFVDGKPSGTTPLHLKGLHPDTPLEVKVVHKGYLDYHTHVTLEAGGGSELSAILKKAPVAAPAAVSGPRPAFHPLRSLPTTYHYHARAAAPKKVAPSRPAPPRRRRRRLSSLDQYIHKMATGQQ